MLDKDSEQLVHHVNLEFVSETEKQKCSILDQPKVGMDFLTFVSFLSKICERLVIFLTIVAATKIQCLPKISPTSLLRKKSFLGCYQFFPLQFCVFDLTLFLLADVLQWFRFHFPQPMFPLMSSVNVRCQSSSLCGSSLYCRGIEFAIRNTPCGSETLSIYSASSERSTNI